MIGYNIEEVNNLITAINASYKKLGETMASGWPNVSNTLHVEWVGPDKISFEEQLAGRVCDLYHACYQNLSEMISNIRTAAQVWKDFQTGNIIQGANTKTTLMGVAYEISSQNLEVYEIEKVVKFKGEMYGANTRFGVVNGEASASNIDKAVSNYVSNVSSDVTSMYSQIKSGAAFLGTQSSKIDEYIESIGREVAKLTTSVDDLRQSLATLVKNYTEQNASVSGSFGGTAGGASSIPKMM